MARGDIFATLDAGAFQLCFVAWVAALTNTPAEVIANVGTRDTQNPSAADPPDLRSLRIVAFVTICTDAVDRRRGPPPLQIEKLAQPAERWRHPPAGLNLRGHRHRSRSQGNRGHRSRLSSRRRISPQDNETSLTLLPTIWRNGARS